jgi:uncharacterized protein (DUF2147 family)
MPMMSRTLGVAAFAAFAMAAGQAFAGQDPTGVWMNDTGRGAVEIKPCGEALCGHVVWVKDTSDTKGCGRQILGNVMPAGEGTWDNGWIYSPERKKKYDVELKPLADGTLRVKGYAGTKLFSKTMIWTPAPKDMSRCGEMQAAANPASGTTTSTTVVKAASVEEIKARAKTEPAAAAPTAAKDAPATETAPATAPASDVAAASPAPEQDVAQDESGAAEDSDLADALGKFLKKGPNGRCKLDLPWVKVDFTCDGK